MSILEGLTEGWTDHDLSGIQLIGNEGRSELRNRAIVRIEFESSNSGHYEGIGIVVYLREVCSE